METKEKNFGIDPILNLEKDVMKVKLNGLIHRAIHVLHDHSDKLLDDDPSNDAVGLQNVVSDLNEVCSLVRCRMNL